jgi:hypothetical protein
MKSLSKHTGLLLLGLSLFSIPGLRAQVPPLPDDFPVLVAEAPDNSAGFTALRKRMAALPANAVPVTLIFIRGEYNQQGGMDSGFPTHWMGKNETGETVLVSLTQTLTGSVHALEPSKQGRGWNMDVDAKKFDYVVQHMPIEPSLRKMFTTLSSTEDEQGNWEMMQLMSDPGALFLHATRLHEAGYTSQGNQLAAYLFEKIGKQSALILSLSGIINEEYNLILERFYENKDTAALIKDAEALLAKNQRVWNAAPALTAAIAEWKAALALPADAIPEVEGLTLPPEVQALYRDLASNPKRLTLLAQAISDENWLLMPASLVRRQFDYYPDGEGDTEAMVKESQTLLLRIHKLGPAALPLFQTMLVDPRLIAVSDDSYVQRMHNRLLSGGNDASVQIAKPSTYRQMAFMFVSGILPPNMDIDEEDPESIADSLAEWQREIAGKSRVELARIFLEKTEDSPPQEALYTLLASAEASDVALAFRVMLESESPEMYLSMALGYAKLKPEEGKPLLKGLSDKMQELYADELNNKQSHYARMYKQLQEAQGIRDVAVAEESPNFEAALNSLLANTEQGNDMELRMAVGTAAKSMSPEELEKNILGRVTQDQPMVTQTLLGLLKMQESGMMEQMYGHGDDSHILRFYMNPDELSEDEEEKDEEETMKTMDAVVEVNSKQNELWLPLLEAGDTDATKMNAFIVAMFVLQDYLDESSFLLHRVGGIQDPDILNLILSLARRSLTEERNEWMQDIPSIESVSEERINELRGILAGNDTAAIRNLLASATVSERMVMLIQSQEDAISENEVWADFQDETLTLRHVIHEAKSWKFPADKALTPGQRYSIDLLKTLIPETQKLALAGKTGSIVLNAIPFQRGISVHATDKAYGPNRNSSEGEVNINLSAPNLRYSAKLRLDETPDLSPPVDDGKSDADADAEDFMGLFGGEQAPSSEHLSRNLHRMIKTPIPLGGQFTVMITFHPAATVTEK